MPLSTRLAGRLPLEENWVLYTKSALVIGRWWQNSEAPQVTPLLDAGKLCLRNRELISKTTIDSKNPMLSVVATVDGLAEVACQGE